MSIEVLAAFLKTVGAFQTRHSGKTLGHHLLGTYALLADAGCDEETCLAGGLHSIYGTDRFKTQTCDPGADSERIADLFGRRAEELAYLFYEISPRTQKIERGDIAGCGMARALRLIEAANILEQGGSLDRWPRIKAAWMEQLEATHEARSEA
jgi:hypothetical protein